MNLAAYDLIIIGAGPAGLTAGLYAGRSKLNTLILEKMSVGGRIMTSETIENFPGFPGSIATDELISRMHQQVKDLDIKIELDEVLDINCKDKTVKTSSSDYSSVALIIAAGARPKKIGIPGEDKFTGKGVSYCAICDAPFYKGKDVFVVGGGNTVAEEALYLSRFAKSVTIIHRRNDLRASNILQERLKSNNKINFVLSHIATEISGSNKVEKIKVKDVNSQKEKELTCDGVFIYIGYEPETSFLKSKIKIDEKGFIVTDEDMHTSEEGIFACGDCRKKSLFQVITACADGAIAAESAYKYITSRSI